MVSPYSHKPYKVPTLPIPKLDERQSKNFWSHVEKTESCWNWTGCIDEKGYGQVGIWLNERCVRFKPHRVAYRMIIGPIPEGLTLDHLCRNHRCLNPAHLEPLTLAENLLRGNTVCGINSRKTHCRHGHILSGKNLHIKTDGSRRCVTCHAENARRAYGKASKQ